LHSLEHNYQSQMTKLAEWRLGNVTEFTACCTMAWSSKMPVDTCMKDIEEKTSKDGTSEQAILVKFPAGVSNYAVQCTNAKEAIEYLSLILRANDPASEQIKEKAMKQEASEAAQKDVENAETALVEGAKATATVVKGKGRGKGAAPPPKAPPPNARRRGASAKAAATAKPIGKRLAGIRARARSTEALRRKNSIEDQPGPAFDPTAVDIDALHRMFAVTQPGTSTDKSSKRPSIAHVELLDNKVVWQLEIVFRKLKCDFVELSEALGNFTLEACDLTADEAERLVKVLPSEKQLYSLMKYKLQGNDPKNLRDTEQKLLPLAALKRLQPRLRILVSSKTLGERTRKTLHETAILQSACHALRESDVFQYLLKIVGVVFNYINFDISPANSGASPTRTPDVRDLMRLRETKAPFSKGLFPGYNMLHYCLHQLLRQRPELCCDHWKQQLGVLADAQSISLLQLRHGLSQLKEDQVLISSELRGHSQAYEQCWVREPCDMAEPERPVAPQDPEALDLDVLAKDEDDEHDVPDLHALSGKRLSLLARIQHKVVDAAYFLQDRYKGHALIGRAEHSDCIQPASVDDDGGAAPHGLLWRLCPSGRWRKYECEVRGPSILVLYRIQASTCLTTSYMPLPFAEVSSIYASKVARKHDKDHPNAFEIRLSGRSDTEIFQASSSHEVARWVKFLAQQACRPGVGSLSFYVGGGWDPWKRLFCVLDRSTTASTGSTVAGTSSGPRLLGFAYSRHCVQGRTPDYSWPLTNSIVRFLDADGASDEAKRRVESIPHGLELEDSESGKLWHFACDSLSIQRMWHEELSNLGCQETSRPAKPLTLQASFQEPAPNENELAPDENVLFDLFGSQTPVKEGEVQPLTLSFQPKEEAGSVEPLGAARPQGPVKPVLLSFRPTLEEGTGDSSDEHSEELATVEEVGRIRLESDELHASTSECTPDVAPEPAELGALGQLKRFDAEIAAAVEQWTCALAATEADCRDLMRFFDFEAPSDGTGLASATLQLVEALSTFQGQVSTAWDEIERHSRGGSADRREPRPSQRLSQSSQSSRPRHRSRDPHRG